MRGSVFACNRSAWTIDLPSEVYRPGGAPVNAASGAQPQRLDADHAGGLKVRVLVGAEAEQTAVDAGVVFTKAWRRRAGPARRGSEPPRRNALVYTTPASTAVCSA